MMMLSAISAASFLSLPITMAWAQEVQNQTFRLDEEFYRFPIFDTLVEVFEQWLLFIVWTWGVVEVIEKEKFRPIYDFTMFYPIAILYLPIKDKMEHIFPVCQEILSSPQVPRFISERVYALSDATRWWYEYGNNVLLLNNV